jgi:hypothetical protein
MRHEKGRENEKKKERINTCWFTHKKPYVPYETMIEMMVESTSSSSNMHGDAVADLEFFQ